MLQISDVYKKQRNSFSNEAYEKILNQEVKNLNKNEKKNPMKCFILVCFILAVASLKVLAFTEGKTYLSDEEIDKLYEEWSVGDNNLNLIIIIII